MTEKRFSVKQRQGATIYSIEDYYGELPLSEGMYYKSNAEKLCKWLNTQHELLNTLYNENEQLKQFQTNTFTLINEMIENANLYREPIHTLDYGDDLGYWNGVYQKLKELRDILENEEARR